MDDKNAKDTMQTAPSECSHCFHLLDGYLHGHDVPEGHVKEECCHCSATRIIRREECMEITRRSLDPDWNRSSKMWSLSDGERCQRVRKTFDTSSEDGDSERPKLKGFALLPDDVRREIARRGGKAAQRSPDARRWTSETAREAGRLGGRAVHEKRREMGSQTS